MFIKRIVARLRYLTLSALLALIVKVGVVTFGNWTVRRRVEQQGGSQRRSSL